MNQPKKKILFLTTEISPFTETYQLAEFSKKFSNYINDDEDYDIRISQPKYGFISERKYILREVIRLKEVPINFNGKERIMSIKSAFIPNTRVQVYFLLDNDYFFEINPLVYKSKNGHVNKNNFENFSLFSLSLLESFKKLFWYPDIIICNDWQTSILPMLLKNNYSDDEKYKNIKTINFIHSINNYRKLNVDCFAKFDLDVKFKKDMDIISESMNFFDLNIVLDDDKKNVSNSIKKDKSLSASYKKNKSKTLKYPYDKDSWDLFYQKFNSTIGKL
tara:strand:- start:70 stop:897 length:828 start_codon:yes stop_codon:yes gene_type:complete